MDKFITLLLTKLYFVNLNYQKYIYIEVTWQNSCSSCRIFISGSSLDRLPPQYSPPRRNGGVKAEQDLLTLACLWGFRLNIISGLVRNVTDFFLAADDVTAEDGLLGFCAAWWGGRPQSRGLAGITGESENTGFKRSTETASTLSPIWRRKNLLRRSKTR